MAKFKKLTKKVAVSIGIATALLIILVGFLIWNGVSSNSDGQSGSVSSSAPTFQALLPQGSTIEDLGGWQKLTPPNSKPYYVFVDSINDVVIQVSQQALPEAFQSNTHDRVAELAAGYNATETLKANGITIYIGNSSKGPQSVIFTKDNLLILIKSDSKIDNNAWISYIKSLV